MWLWSYQWIGDRSVERSGLETGSCGSPAVASQPSNPFEIPQHLSPARGRPMPHAAMKALSIVHVSTCSSCSMRSAGRR